MHEVLSLFSVLPVKKVKSIHNLESMSSLYFHFTLHWKKDQSKHLKLELGHGWCWTCGAMEDPLLGLHEIQLMRNIQLTHHPCSEIVSVIK